VKDNHSDTPFDDRLNLALPLFGYIGGLGLPIALIGFAAIGASRKWLVTIGGVFVVGLILIGALPSSWQQWFNGGKISLNSTWMIASWALVFTSLLLCTLFLVFRSNGTFRRRADVYFLIGWFWMELGASFALTPFPAARRVMAVLVVSTFVVGRLASRRPQFRPLIHGIAWFGIGLGIFYASIDFVDAFVEKRAARLASETIDGAGERWYVGHWGFQFYAERNGMRPIFPDESELQRGDWLILPDSALRPVAQSIRLDDSKLELRSQFELSLPMPYRTLPDLYGGRSPIGKQEGPRIRISIYRVLDRWKPKSFYP